MTPELDLWLRSLRGRLPGCGESLPDDLEPAVRQVDASDDLPARFAAAAKRTGAHVHLVTLANWVERVAAALAAQSARRVLLGASGALDAVRAAALSDVLRAAGVDVATPRDDDELFALDAAVTGADAAIAETGSVVCSAGPSRARAWSLVPPMHCVLLTVDQILPDLWDWLRALDELDSTRPLNGSSNVNLITGMSKTADIEGVLVPGVHGPGRVEIFALTA